MSEPSLTPTPETVPGRFRLPWLSARPTSRKPRSKRARLFNRIGGVLLLAYLLLLCFPQILFAQSVAYKQFRVYSSAPLNPQIYAILDKAAQKLTRSELNDPALTHRIFLCPNHTVFTLLNPASRLAFGVNQPFRHNIFINTADVAENKVTTESERHNQRTLSGVITHECTHTLLAQALGQWRVLRLPSWKMEGYCDYMADETSFDPAEGARLLKQGGSDESPSFRYFKAQTAIHYLLNQRRLSVPQIMQDQSTLEGILGESQTNATK